MKFDVPFSYNFNGGWKLGTGENFSSDDIIQVAVFDKDSYSDHDLMGGFRFKRSTIFSMFPKNKNTKENISKEHNLKLVIHYKWTTKE